MLNYSSFWGHFKSKLPGRSPIIHLVSRGYKRVKLLMVTYKTGGLMERDDEKKEILKLLALIREYAERLGGVDTPVRIAYLNKYIEEYSKPEPKISQSTFMDLHDPKNVGTDAKNTVRVYMGDKFKPFIKKYFETEGVNLPYHLTFPSKGYLLVLIDNPSISQSANSQSAAVNISKHIQYEEHQYCTLKYRPLLHKLIIMLFQLILPTFLLTGLIFIWIGRSKSLPLLVAGILLLLVIGPLLLIVLSLNKLPKVKLTFLLEGKYFLRLSDQNIIILASYSGTCPICGGRVELVHSRAKWRGHVAKCEKYPEGHVFSFDPTDFTGERL
jgi:hypothetical protein